MQLTLPQILLVIFLATIIVAEFVFLLKLIYFAFRGAPYAATDDATVKEMVKEITKSEKVIDLGSGDGKIILALAENGVEAHGVELPAPLVWWTRWQINKRGLKKKAFIRQEDMWKTDISSYDVIIVFQITYVMKRMEKKLRAELKPGARVISNQFTFPTWKPKQVKGRLHIYTN